MIQAAITFASVILASAIAYLAALAAWRRQQRREVYGAYIAAVDDVLESLDLVLAEPEDVRVSKLGQWKEFHDARHRFDMAWGQVRLVAPTNIAHHARNTGHALINFERDARNLSVSQARTLREAQYFLSWDQAGAFVIAARSDLRVESRILEKRPHPTTAAKSLACATSRLVGSGPRSSLIILGIKST